MDRCEFFRKCDDVKAGRLTPGVLQEYIEFESAPADAFWADAIKEQASEETLTLYESHYYLEHTTYTALVTADHDASWDDIPDLIRRFNGCCDPDF